LDWTAVYFKFICPSCGKSLKVRDEHIGHRSRCPYCRSTVTITAPEVGSEPAAAGQDPLDQLAAVASGRGVGAGNEAPRDALPQARVRSKKSSGSGQAGKRDAAADKPSTQAGAHTSATDVSQLMSLLIALSIGLALYAGLFVFARGSYFGDLFLERGWVPFVLVLLMGWSAGILSLKWVGLRRQKEAMLFDALPTDIGETITLENVGQFARQIRELPGDVRNSFLLNRVLRGLEHFRVRRNTQEVAAVLSSQSDIDATSVQSSYTILKVFIWAIPILGFIGTVIGIGESIGSFTGAMDSAEDVAVLKESLTGVTSGLATAFDTTLIALVMSLLVMFPTSSMQKAEDDLLNWVDEYCNENLLKRLSEPGDSGKSIAGEEVRRAVELAMAKHYNEVASWSRTMEQAAEVTRRITAMQQDHVDRLGEIGKAVDRQELALQERLQANGQALVQHLASVGEGLSSLNHVLEQLDGKQVVIHQQRRGWFGGRKNPKANSDG